MRLTHLSGPGARDVNFVPNVLFLPDGFTDADKADYERMVRLVVTRLSTRNRTRPFAALTGRMNYFMGWLPSPEPGVSVLNELDRTEKTATRAQGRTLELPSVTRRAPNRWQLDDLINAIGLPTPVDDPDGSTLTDAKVTAWQRIYGNFVTKPRVQPLFDKWLARNDRVLLNERDTAFHMAFGDRPGLAGTTPAHALSLNPRRLAESDFNDFLDSLRGPKGEALGPLWTTGKDNDLVVVLCRTVRNGGLNVTRSTTGTNDARTLGVSLGAEGVHHMRPNTGGDGFDLVPDNVPTNIFFRLWLTAAHELAHSWTLGDEYGGLNTPAPPHLIVSSSRDANVQDRASLLIGGDLSTDKLKWGAWPRIAKAGVLGLQPTLAGGKLTVVLVDVKAARLRVNDVVRLRARPLPTAGPPSARCKIESITDSKIVMVPLFGAAVDPTEFPAGSILMAPVRRKDPNPAADVFGGELTVADIDVLIRIVETGNPLNAQPTAGEGAAPNDAIARPCRNVELKMPTAATNFPDRKAPTPPRFSSWIVGLYENGGRHNCGIYRPTGICLMGEQATIDTAAKSLNLYDFCIVCRYAMIDAVDPTLHGQVEIDYVGRYGRRGAR